MVPEELGDEVSEGGVVGGCVVEEDAGGVHVGAVFAICFTLTDSAEAECYGGGDRGVIDLVEPVGPGFGIHREALAEV